MNLFRREVRAAAQSHVHGVSHRLEMFRVHATGIRAEMVNFQALSNRAEFPLKEKSVRRVLFSAPENAGVLARAALVGFSQPRPARRETSFSRSFFDSIERVRIGDTKPLRPSAGMAVNEPPRLAPNDSAGAHTSPVYLRPPAAAALADSRSRVAIAWHQQSFAPVTLRAEGTPSLKLNSKERLPFH